MFALNAAGIHHKANMSMISVTQAADSVTGAVVIDYDFVFLGDLGALAVQ